MIKGNFNVKKIDMTSEDKEKKELEALILKSGAGSHMVFRSDDNDDDLFKDEF